MISFGRLVLALVLAAPSLFAVVETWTDLLGHKIEAEFLGKSGNSVSFKKSDGSKYLMPLAKLIADDRARVFALTEGGDSPSLRVRSLPRPRTSRSYGWQLHPRSPLR
jgi:hypothetical protein